MRGKGSGFVTPASKLRPALRFFTTSKVVCEVSHHFAASICVRPSLALNKNIIHDDCDGVRESSIFNEFAS